MRSILMHCCAVLCAFNAVEIQSTRAADAFGADAQPAVLVMPGRINMRAGDVVTAAVPNLLHDRPAFQENRRYVVQLDGPITPQRRDRLEAIGVVLGDYLPTWAYIADLSRTDAAALSRLGFVTWTGEYRNEWKIEPAIGQRELVTDARRALDAAGLVAVEISLFDGFELDPALDAIEQIPGVNIYHQEDGDEIVRIGSNYVIPVIMPRENVPLLAGIDAVQFVEEAAEFVTRRNNSVRWIVQTNMLNVNTLYNNGLRGEGQIVGILDTKIDVNHCSFVDPANSIGPNHRKIHAYNTSLGQQSHGTHVGGIVTGDSGGNNNARGVAYLGRLVYHTIPSLTQNAVFNRHQTHHNQGARIHTNSWGSANFVNTYHGTSRAIDNFMRQNEESLVVHSVANSNNDGPTISIPENAKNLLAVGATSKFNPNNHCTAKPGPTIDGRRKPEVFAPGCNVNSSANNSSCSTTGNSGTSMATPAVAGLAMLVRQYFTDGYHPTGTPNPSDAFIPTGALVKAALVNSAQRMTGSGTGSGYPNNVQGWGRVLGNTTLHFVGQPRKLIAHERHNNVGLSTGQSVEHVFYIAASNEPLRVTLAFIDVPGSAGSSAPVVNDLDLEVVSPTGTLYRGNVFGDGVSIPGGSKDPVNNVEQVHINNPAIGQWTARVKAAAVNSQSQGYGLIVTGAVTEVALPPPNNTCAASINVPEGDTPFTTFDATTDGPTEPLCDFAGSEQIDSDVWFRHTAACTGTLHVSLCDSPVAFDSKLALYGIACPTDPGTALACNKDHCGQLSALTLQVLEGDTIRIRIGGHNEAEGEGVLTIECIPDAIEPPCPADLNGSGSVGVPDLLELLANWGPCPAPCPADLTGTGSVGVPDLLELLAAWGPCP